MDNVERLNELLGRMTLEEKIGQMTQIEKDSLTPDEVRKYCIGSVLSGGGGNPQDNSAAGWATMVWEFQEAALQSRLGIPLLYGVDAVHGHNNLRGAVIFPHNIGLGAARDVEIVRRIGRATAEELAATGIYWNFAPTVAVPQDIRWGRTFEGYAQESALVASMARAYIEGLQDRRSGEALIVLATAKHYFGDGATSWGTSRTNLQFPPGFLPEGFENPVQFKIDQGDSNLDETTLRRVHLTPYESAIQSGALVVMASLSSWNGLKLHGHHYLLTDVLKGELGFTGFIVSDWAGIDPVDDDYYLAVVKAINAGIDMSMVPYDYKRFIETLRQAVENGDVLMERIDDAVQRILRVKLKAGLFDQPRPDFGQLSMVGALQHRKLAREAVSRSLVLLKNDQQTLPLKKSLSKILVAGQAAEDIGLQCGGWTIEWLGKPGAITPGMTILEGIRHAVLDESRVLHDPNGRFEIREPSDDAVGIVVLAEKPYAEGFGDREDLNLPAADVQLIERLRPLCRKLILVLLSGRPLIVTNILSHVDAFVAAWLPGTEGDGIADVLFGDLPFTGKLSYSWPRSMDQVPMPPDAEPLFPFGFGLLAG